MEKIDTVIAAHHRAAPVNIEAMIEDLGINLVRKGNLDPEIAGQIERLTDGSYRITVNSSNNYFRRRFTMAHELAHWILHRDLIEAGVDDTPAYRSTNAGMFFNQNIRPTHETQANQLAAYLLMPDELVRKHFNETGGSLADMAKKFLVSQDAMRIRLQGLGLVPH